MMAGHGDGARLGYLPFRLTSKEQVQAMKAAVSGS
jgi:hypothetical protein